MNDDQLIEISIQGHASTRDAIRYAIQQERKACAETCKEVQIKKIKSVLESAFVVAITDECAKKILSRGNN